MNKIFNVKAFENVLKTRFIYDHAFSIYGGSSGLFDIGPVGFAIQNNIVNEWRKHFVLKDHMLEIECSIITPEVVLKNSGHLGKFCDLMVRDEETNESFRADHLIVQNLEKRLKKLKNPSDSDLPETISKVENSQLSLSELDDLIEHLNIKSPTSGNKLSETKPFNLMFQTHVGPSGQSKISYLRPETTQGIFLNFKRLFKQQPVLPLKAAQVGKAFRNEISPRSGLLRQREFLQAEIAHFLHPESKSEKYDLLDEQMEQIELHLLSNTIQNNSINSMQCASKMTIREAIDNKIIKSETMAYYIGRTYQFAVRCGIDKERIRFREHLCTELAHYANECWDFECNTSHGWIECAGIADRCDYDLRQHSESGENFSIEKIPSIDKFLVKLKQIILKSHSKETDLIINNLEQEKFQNKIQKFIQNDNAKELRLASDYTMNRREVIKIYNQTNVILPHVIEPSFGIGRLMYAILEHNFKTRPSTDNTKIERSYLSLPYLVAPYKCCILPLNDTDERYQPIIRKLSNLLSDGDIAHIIDSRSGSIGKRYSRADEIGIKYALTLDYETLEDSATVTLRERDSMDQIRVKIYDVVQVLADLSRKK